MNLALVRKNVLSIFLLVFLSGVALADNAVVIKKLSAIVPGISPTQVSKTPVNGLYQVMIGTQVVYISADGRYLLQGEMIDLDTRKNLTQEASNSLRKVRLDGVDEKQMIVYPAKDEEYKITVFSDIDCVYCRKLHASLKSYLEAGITVRYMFMPRSGPNTDSYFKAVSVWCAEDRNEALTDAKLKNKVVNKTCDNPVDEHMAIASEFGITGTPAIITASGRLIPGFVPAEHLVKELN